MHIRQCVRTTCVSLVFALSRLIIAHADERSEFLDFYDSKLAKVIKNNYESCTFIAMSGDKYGQNSPQNTLRLERWRINGNLRVVKGYFKKQKDKSIDLYFKMTDVPGSIESNPVTGILIKNSIYHGHLSGPAIGQHLVERLHSNSQRKSEEKIPTMWAYGFPDQGLTFRDIVESSKTKNFSWKAVENSSKELKLSFFDAEQELGLVARFSQKDCVEHCRLVGPNWAHEIDYTYTTDSPEPIIKTVRRKASGTDAPEILSTFVISELRHDELSEAECHLPAFGIAEPAEFESWRTARYLFLFFAFSLVGVLTLWMYRKVMHNRKKAY